ncbi:MAG: hypothetical protein HC910_01820 [Spirulinaceae cyanobacterium SM2_1_0]|nr:hypothetical protein [Spirulinaceae cyanobacterium SM2_1_0]
MILRPQTCRHWLSIATLGSVIALSTMAIAPQFIQACSLLPSTQPTPLSQRLEVIPDTAQGDANQPTELIARLRRQVANWSQQPLEAIALVSAERQRWSDGCLGLYLPDTACLAAETPGWQITLTVDGQEWRYRTNEPWRETAGETPEMQQGFTLLENGVEVLPAATRTAVFAQIATDYGVAAEQLRLTLAYPKVWGGCFGIYERPAQPCTMQAIPGWQLVIESESGDRGWTYHTNLDGSDARLNPGLSSARPAETSVQLEWQP